MLPPMQSIVRILAVTAAGATAMAGPAFAQEGDQVTAEVMTADGESAGTVLFKQVEHGVVITAELMNLPEGAHGFHIHETGACKPDFKAAGSHFAPAGHEHGYDTAEGYHAGDLPNIHAQADGTAQADFFASWLTLGEGAGGESGPYSLSDEDGSAIMVHGMPDDYRSVDSAGERIACGVIVAPQD